MPFASARPVNRRPVRTDIPPSALPNARFRGKMVPAGKRDACYPVYYVEPYQEMRSPSGLISPPILPADRP